MIELRINRSAPLTNWPANAETTQVIAEHHARLQAGWLPASATVPKSLGALSWGCRVLQHPPPASDPDGAGPEQLAGVPAWRSGQHGPGLPTPRCSCGSQTPRAKLGGGWGHGGRLQGRDGRAGAPSAQARSASVGRACGFCCSHGMTHSSVPVSRPGPRGRAPNRDLEPEARRASWTSEQGGGGGGGARGRALWSGGGAGRPRHPCPRP